MADIVGTEERDIISGTGEDDNIQAGGGDDDVSGGDGNDTIDGGDGDDRLFGQGGDDTIDGGLGNDFLSGGIGTNILRGGDGDDSILSSGEDDFADGEAGNDDIRVEFFGFDPVDPGAQFGVNPTVVGGTGNDTVTYFADGTDGSIDLGADDDTLNLSLVGSGISITLGSGIDTINLFNLTEVEPGSATITDFVAGDSGEVIDFSAIQELLFEYDGFANPFGTGHFVLEADGAGSVIRFSPSASGFFIFSLFFPNVAPSEFTAHNFGGLLPSGEDQFGPPIEGTPDPDTLDGTDLGETISGLDSDDTINAMDGDDTIIGGAGSDTLNGGDGNDTFIFDFSSEPGFNPSEDPALDASIDGGAGTDTVRIIGSNQGVDIVEYDIGSDLPITSIEELELSGNTALLGTIAQFNAFSSIIAPNLRITDNGVFDPTGYFEVTQLSLPNGGISIDLSGDNIHVLNIVSGDGDDTIIGPDSGIANPTSNQTQIEIGIDVRDGNDVVIAGNIATFISSQGGNNDFTGSAFDDNFILFGDGNNIIDGGAGNDDISIFGVGNEDVSGGDGDDFIEIENFDATDVVSGGDGEDTLALNANGELLDLTDFALPTDVEILQVTGSVRLNIAQIQSFTGLSATELRIADGGSLALSIAPVFVYLSTAGNEVDFRDTITQVIAFGNIGDDIIYGGQGFNNFNGDAGNDQLFGNNQGDDLSGGFGFDLLDGGAGNDTLRGDQLDDRLIGGLGDDFLDGGSHIDTAVFSGNRDEYTITQTSFGVFEIVGPDGTDTLETVEFAEFDDETIRLYRGEGVSVNFDTADPSVYQDALFNIRDFDGNGLGGDGFWLRIGSADINGDGDIDQILVNFAIGRFATVGTAPDGLVYFGDYSWGGETRVAGIYIDPLVASGDVVAGSPGDSQARFQNDLEIENINRVLGADDYDGDGIQEVYFALTDGTAYLRALMHADGNIRYANYQSEQQVRDYLDANGFGEETYGDWFPEPSDPPPGQENPDPEKDEQPVSDPQLGGKSGGSEDSAFTPETPGGMSGEIRLASTSMIEDQIPYEFFG